MTARPQSPARPTAATELRRAFVDFFVGQGHVHVPSSPLVPHGDATLLFTTAGMVQFKPYYLGAGDVPYTRAVSIQKCLRATDLENVGLSPRHDTFFEMLGNFSFGFREKGAYFKQEAIDFAWQFLREGLGLPQEKLFATFFSGEGDLPEDAETHELWRRHLPDARLRALGRKDNFWGPAGGQGPCGPCSEIYYDLGPEVCLLPGQQERLLHRPEDCYPGADCDRYMEFWNLVFPQFDAQPDGRLVPLARPGVDTGMGIERLAMIVQGKPSIFKTDLFEPLVRLVLRHRPVAIPPLPGELSDACVVADHIRALTFAIAEGALPSNEGAGYVLRRLLRRAVTRLRSKQGLAIAEPLLPMLGREVVERFGVDYPELRSGLGQIAHTLAREEGAFSETYEAGRQRLEALLDSGVAMISGEDAFVLHDTYGFPLELTQEIAAERGLAVDLEGFQRAMEEQRRRARAASKFDSGTRPGGKDWHEVSRGPDSEFLGYETLAADELTLRRWREWGEGELELELVLDRTPCYAEAGGQVADRGRIEGADGAAELTHVYKEGEVIVHRTRLVRGSRDDLLAAGARGALRAVVLPEHRLPTMRHHTATHLLHAALRKVLGSHVRQAGSLVAPDRLRFDYQHYEAPTREQLEEIERMVVDWALHNREVTWEILPLERAKGLGAMALFGEKYGNDVRVVTVAGVEEAGIPTSRELCGGTHVSRTGDIGAFVVVSDSSIASGVRRIEALCGLEALRYLKAQAETLARAATLLHVRPENVPDQAERMRQELERLRKAQAHAARGGLAEEVAALAANATRAPGGRWVVASLSSEAEAGAVRDATDRLRGQLGRGAAMVAFHSGGKLGFVAAVSDDLVAEGKLRADELARRVAQVAGGSGGGKPHLALAGGKDAGKLAEALAEARRLLGEALGS